MLRYKGYVRRLQEEAYMTWTTYINFKKKNKRKEAYNVGGERNDPKEGYNSTVKLEVLYLGERPAIAKCKESALYRNVKLATLLVVESSFRSADTVLPTVGR
jgi:hypothetical protein